VRLLDLPDEVLDQLEQGALSEGHGRALLLAEDHGARRSLARTAAAEGWSVRTVETRARASNADANTVGGGRKGATRGEQGAGRGTHPDQAAAAQEIAEALSAALGADVQVKPTRSGGYRAELELAGPEEALELARRLRPRAVA
jgi:ParB family transcriptional regulator, chromosome partitioning protein